MDSDELDMPDKAAFLMALGDLDVAVKENELFYNDPSCAAEQRRNIELQILAKYYTAYGIHLDIREADLAGFDVWLATYKRLVADRAPRAKAEETRKELLRKASTNPILKAALHRPTKNQDVVPLRTQMVSWMVSAAFVGLSNIDLHTHVAHVAMTSLALLALLAPQATLEKVRVRTSIYWFALYSLTAAAATFIVPTLDILSTEPHTCRQVLLIHWCLSFFIISEAEWWRHLRRAMSHPIKRDLQPRGYTQHFFKDFGLVIARWVLSGTIGALLLWGLRCVGDVPGERSGFHYEGSNGLYASTLKGQVPQALILLRPMRQLTAWTTDETMEFGERLWNRVREQYKPSGNPGV